jgi:hypothetical protein
MGSFASSIHVRSNDTAAVLAALDACLCVELTGYVRQTDVPASLAPPARGLYIAHALEGWVGVLDSDFHESRGLAADLAAELDTPVLQVLVRDSHFWHYQLFRGGPDLLGSLLPTEAPGPRKRRARRGGRYLRYLRPLLKEGVTDSQVLDALARQTAFAEEDLAVFLPLLGIPALWAHLSYDNLPEMSPSRLQEAGIILAEHRLCGPSEGSGR